MEGGVATDSVAARNKDDDARLRAVLETAVDGIITIDEKGMIEAANPAAERLFGYESAEMIGQNVNMLMPSPYQEEHDTYLNNYNSTRVPKIIGSGREVAGKRKDGTTFPLYLAVSEVSMESRRTFTGFVHDLTDLKKAEEHATQLGRILEGSLNEIFIFDPKALNFVFASHGARVNMGYTAAELKELTPVDITPELSKEQYLELFLPLVSGEKSELIFETVHKRKDGSHYNVHIRLLKATWEDREVLVAVTLDITERKRMEIELAKLNGELEERVENRTRELREAQAQLVRKEKLAALGHLSGGVAHEIRNPLGVIKNSVYYLKTFSNQVDEEARECIDEIDREVETANRIVSELLDFTRDPVSHPDVFCLNDAINNSLRNAAIPENIELVMDATSSNVMLCADQGQIERILTNLIRNACQAMPGGGRLTISNTIERDQTRIEVRDTGIGIPAEDLSHIFEPLFTTKAKGIGLGLAVSRRYAQRNGGSLTVDSQPGQGTALYLSVPTAGATP